MRESLVTNCERKIQLKFFKASFSTSSNSTLLALKKKYISSLSYILPQIHFQQPGGAADASDASGLLLCSGDVIVLFLFVPLFWTWSLCQMLLHRLLCWTHNTC